LFFAHLPWVRRQVAGSRSGRDRRAHADPWHGRIESRPNWSQAKHRSGKWLVTYSIRSSLASLSGSRESFQVRVRWKEVPRVQDLPGPFAADTDGADGAGGQVLGELCVTGGPASPGVWWPSR